MQVRRLLRPRACWQNTVCPYSGRRFPLGNPQGDMIMNEQFSAFLDNEATRDESDGVISALLRDESLRDSWTRQHQIRDVLRASTGDTVASVDVGFSTRVMQAINEDAAVPQPAIEAAEFAHSSTSKVVPMRQGRRRRRWHNMTGLAVAASAAGVAFFVMQPMQRLSTTPAPQAATTQQTATLGTGPATVATADTGDAPELHFATAAASEGGYDTPWDWAGGLVRSVASRGAESADHWAVSDPTLASRLNDFLVEHNGLARGYGLGATTPGFVRVATYGQGFAQ